MGKSIFDLTDKTGYESPWEENWAEAENINSSRTNTNNSSASSSGKVIKLTKDNKFAIKTDFILRFKFYGYENFIYSEDYTITLTCSDSAVKTYNNSLTTENGEVFLFKIYRDKPAKVKLYIAINGVRKYTYDIEFIESKVIFSSADIKRLKTEYELVENFNSLDPPPPEYAGNYCMQGADRALGKLLNDSVNFYTVTNDNKVITSINFSGLNTYSRAEQYKSKGYIYGDYTVDNKFWKVDHAQRERINNAPNYDEALIEYGKVMYSIVKMSEAKGKLFEKHVKYQIDTREPGWHVYYLSITDGYHTLLLLIDNTDRDSPKYEIWDDHGKSSSHGMLKDIVSGINRQTSWTFASTCLGRRSDGTTDQWDSQKLKMWRIKKK